MQLVASASGRAEREYLPRGDCLAWDPWLIGLHVTADILIFAAFTAIAMATLVFVRRRKMQLSMIGWLFASFIFLSGLAQIASFATLWFPLYGVHIALKLLTAGVALFAAFMVFRLMPQALAIPTQNEYERLLGELRLGKEALEQRVKERTEHIASLMDELGHRLKNVYAVALALARQAGGREPFLSRYTDLLGSLAATHDALVRQEYKGARIRDLLHGQLRAFGLEQDVEARGPDLVLLASTAQMLGLGLHELATNGIKHNPSGLRSVAWREITGADGKERLRFIWRETARSPVTPEPDQGGFGRRLLTRIIPEALGGEARLAVGPHEVTWTLDAPLSSIGTIASAHTRKDCQRFNGPAVWQLAK